MIPQQMDQTDIKGEAQAGSKKSGLPQTIVNLYSPFGVGQKVWQPVPQRDSIGADLTPDASDV